MSFYIAIAAKKNACVFTILKIPVCMQHFKSQCDANAVHLNIAKWNFHLIMCLTSLRAVEQCACRCACHSAWPKIVLVFDRWSRC